MKYTDYYQYLTENDEHDKLYIRTLITKALKRFPYADSEYVYSYCSAHTGGVTIKQLEDDAKSHKWDEDTMKAIYYVTSHKKVNRPTINTNFYSNMDEAKYNSYELNLAKTYELFKGSYEKATGQAWTFEKFASRARNWTFYGDEKGFVAVRFQKSNRIKLVGVAGSTKSIIRGFRELTSFNSDKPIWGAVSLEIGNMIAKLDSNYSVLKLPGGMVGSFLFNAIKTVIPAMSMGGAEITGSKPDGSIIFKYPDVGETNKVLVGNKEYFDLLRSQILILPNIPSLIKSQISKILT